MKIAILICDVVNEKFKAHGEYLDMMTSLFPNDECQCFYAFEGEFPENIDEFDAFVVNGSRHSVYEDIPWIDALKKFVREIRKADKPYIGICFGHQILGAALGGKVEKVGWNVAVHKFSILAREPWMEPFRPGIKLLMMCQDQVVQLPKGAVVLAKTATCPVGIFRVGNMLGIQAHPDFTKEYTKALMGSRVDRIGQEVVDAGNRSLSKKVDTPRMVEWMRNFLA